MTNYIHPTAIIPSSVSMGINNYIGPYCIFGKNVKMGNGNRFEAHCSIGLRAEHRDYFFKNEGSVSIGDKNVFREFVTVNAGTKHSTIIESKVSMLKGSHVGHDCFIKETVNIACNATVGGHSVLGTGAHIGLGANIHQNRVIGAYAMVGMNSTVTKNILPFVVCFGSPSEIYRINSVGLIRSGLKKTELVPFEDWLERVNSNYGYEHIKHKYKKFIEQYMDDLNTLR